MSVLVNSPDTSGHELREKHVQKASQEHNDEIAPNLATSKPSFHLTAPSGWMNDPCGLGYDPTTCLYHMFFQWNPHGNDWGNMSWGHATSTNLVSWKVSPTPALTPRTEYDRCGVFTGCLQATDIHGNPGALTAMYTSVRHLPLHHTLPYITGCESLSLAISKNGGKTWERLDCNPILAGPPEPLSVTGWRDPHLTTWPEEQTTTSESPHHPLHGIVAGGITGKAPAIFVYTVNPRDLRSWTYTGLLVDVGLNFHPSRWSGDFGVNWEVGNLVTLSNNGVSRDFAIMGAEGCLRAEDSLWKTPSTAQHKRQARSQLWMCIKARSLNPTTNKNENEVLAEYVFAGYFDHGCLYAANSFWDPLTSQRIVYGWITEEDLPDESRHVQGWSGMISLPRVANLMTLRNVTKARSSKLESITSIEVIPNIPSEPQTYTIHTLGIKPDPRLYHLRDGAERRQFPDEHLPVSLRDSSNETLPLTSDRWELQAEFSVGSSCGRVGIQIAHTTSKYLLQLVPIPLPMPISLLTTPDLNPTQTTTLSYIPSTETFTIHRPAPENPNMNINHGYESAPHTLFTSLNDKDIQVEETLQIHAFFDNSVLEVFVNGRTVISTRIYCSVGVCCGVRFFAEGTEAEGNGDRGVFDEGDEGSAVLVRAEVWDGLGERASMIGYD